jgi:hypothetical protein
LQDYAIFGGRNAYDKAMNNKAAYTTLKAGEFSVDGIGMDASRVIRIAAKYGDLDIIEAYDTELIADYFEAYLKAVEKSFIKVRTADETKAAWEKYKEIRRMFAPYQTKAQVKANWDRLMADIEGAEYDYKQAL